VVSFGVAPGLILYQFLRLSYMQDPNGMDIPVSVLLPAVLIPCAGAWRLARFNIGPAGGNGFTGVPIPATGLVVASFPLILFYNEYNVATVMLNKWFLYLVILLLSYLMISKWHFIAMKFSDRTLKGNLPGIILAVAAVIAALLLHWLAVPLVFVLYILISFTTKKTAP
jgi:CDP-diacylglycerol---serine O-phosphatidyltransferase